MKYSGGLLAFFRGGLFHHVIQLSQYKWREFAIERVLQTVLSLPSSRKSRFLSRILVHQYLLVPTICQFVTFKQPFSAKTRAFGPNRVTWLECSTYFSTSSIIDIQLVELVWKVKWTDSLGYKHTCIGSLYSKVNRGNVPSMGKFCLHGT